MMYTSWLFGEEKIINWDDKTETDKTWASWKANFKDLYAKKKSHNKAMEKNRIRKRGECEGEQHCLVSIRDMFEEQSDTSRVDQK